MHLVINRTILAERLLVKKAIVPVFSEPEYVPVRPRLCLRGLSTKALANQVERPATATQLLYFCKRLVDMMIQTGEVEIANRRT